MPIIALYVKADLENIASFKPPDDHLWCIDIQNSAGGELREKVMLDPTEEMDLKGSKGTANLVMKDGNREHSMSVVEVKGLVKPLTPDASGDGWVPIVAFECRGIEPLKWHPTDGYEIISTGGTAFDDVDLAEDPTMWADYCAKLSEPVSMSNLEWKFDLLKGAKVVGKS